MSQIGIKLANHDFFPIRDEEGKAPIEKELELTTVRDNQESVQINLFKSDGEFEPVYIGSLIIEDLKKMSCGDATIFLKLKLDENRNLHAEAIDKDSGNKQSLTISIDDLGQFSSNGFDNFDVSTNVDSFDVSSFDSSSASDEDNILDEDKKTEEAETEFSSQTDDDFSFDSVGVSDIENTSDFSSFNSDEDLSFNSDDTQKESISSISDNVTLDDDKDFQTTNGDELYDDEFYEENSSSFPTWLKIFLIVLLLGILALVVALFLKNKMKTPKTIETIDVIEEDISSKIEDNSIEPVEELSIDELTTEAPKKEAEPFPTKEESFSKEEVELNNEEVKEEVKIVRDDSVKKAVRYRIRWGDTLWDISGNFYKNPWNYKKIARYNKIKNPHKIIAGTYITIPAK